jgi:hypothetical protein
LHVEVMRAMRAEVILEDPMEAHDDEKPEYERQDDSNKTRAAEEPPTASEEATEGFITEVESLTPGVAPSEPGTFGKDPS